MKPLRDLIHEIHRRSLWQVLGIYLVASWAVLQVVDTLGGALNLPDWFPSFALALLIVGLPVVLATAFVQEGGPGHHAAETPGEGAATTGGSAGGASEAAPAQDSSTAVRLFTWGKAFTGGVLAFALWGVVAAGWVLFGAGTRAEPVVVAGGGEPRLVVLPLENLTDDPDLDVLGRLAADEIGREIDRRQPVAVVPSSTLASAMRGLGGDPPVRAVADAVRATHAFAGTVSRIGDQLRFEVELVDPASGDRIRIVEPVAGPVARTDSLVTALAGRAAAEAVVAFNPTAAPWVGDMSSPTSVTAYQAFSEQIDAFCRGDNPAAIAAGRRALAESPQFVASIYNLIVAYNNNGQRGPVTDSLFDVLEGLRGQMTRNEELSIDSRRAWWDGDIERAGRAFEEAYRLDPVGRVGGLFEYKIEMGEMTEAARLLEEMNLPGPCPFPGYYTRGMRVYSYLGRYQDELDLVHEYHALYPGRWVLYEAEALIGLGRDAALDSLLRTLEDQPLEVRANRKGGVVSELRAHGRVQAADSLTEATLAELTGPQTRPELILARAGVYYYARRFEESYADLRALEAALGPSPASLRRYGPETMADVAVVFVRVGRDEEASAFSAALDGYFGERPNTLMGAHAMIAAARGDAGEAVRLLQAGAGAFLGTIHREPAFDLIRDDPRFVAATTPR